MTEKTNKNLIPIAIVIAGFLVAGAVLFVSQKGDMPSGIISAERAGEKTINFINDNLLPEGMTASLVSIIDESGVYKIKLEIDGQEFPSYVTKDGKILFPDEGISLDEIIPTFQEPSGAVDPSGKEYPQETLEVLAKCLNERGVKFYGTPGCPYCLMQIEIFGQAGEYLPYVNCAEKMDECEEANVGGVPDWRFPDGSQELGMLPVEELARLSGCELE